MLIDTNKVNVFFTADTHFSHKNIIKYCNRPFANVTEMDETLIANWNAKVGKDDWVFHLGDFCFISDKNKRNHLISRLNGKIFMIWGNHDKYLDGSEFDNAALSSIYEVEFLVEDEMIHFVLSHYAMRVWNKSHHGAIHLYGHSHGTLKDDPNALSMDVGVDCNGYAPISINDVLDRMYKKAFKPIDHHGVR